MFEICGLAQAKINIGLNVLPKREDGFHNLESIFLSIGLADEILVKKSQSLVIECEGLELPEENTFTKAYKAFCSLTGSKQAFYVRVKKHIPSGGGLGGGSSDAAFFIKAMDKLCNTNLSMKELDFIASSVGSDVFFFLRTDFPEGKKNCAALVSGRGENIQPVSLNNEFYLLLILPQIHSSTAQAYSLIDKKIQEGKNLTSLSLDLFEQEFSKNPKDWRFVNSFTSVMEEQYPDIHLALEDLKNTDADFADMSGSGSTVFAIYKDREKRDKACSALRKKWQNRVFCV